MKICCLSKILLLFFLIVSSETIYGQSYGLGFYSHEVDQDKRTALDLSPQKQLYFKADFDIAFDMSFLSAHKADFGYIIRIVENDRRNFDLVYDNEADIFNFIIDGKPSKITFKIANDKLYQNWSNLRIRFNVDAGTVTLYANGHPFTERGSPFKKNNNYKILFGANDYKQFGTTDLPPMKIKDIRIYEQNILKYNWPLNEKSGLTAHEVIAQNDAAVANPLWIKAAHYYWQLTQHFTIAGAASAAFNPDKETLYITGRDSIFNYVVKTAHLSGVSYLSGKQKFNIGNQSIFNNRDSTLYNFYADQKFVSSYNLINRNWNKQYSFYPMTNFLHANKFISYQDTSLYVVGGYGHHLYRNSVQQYHFKSHLWQTVKNVKGDFFSPRYLAALGTTVNGDTSYILGGYGSLSGQQILNPKSFYDMTRFTTKDHTFKKLFTLKLKDDDFAFANSLIIDEKTKTYYGLIFPTLKYDSNLQLIKGSLSNNSYTLVGNAIPYSFNDVFSFADIYYCQASQKFLAVTLVRDKNGQGTQVNIYTLSGPPEVTVAETPVISGSKYKLSYIAAALILIIGLITGGLWYYKSAKKRYKENKLGNPQPLVSLVDEVEEITAASNQVGELPRASIFLFGELQLITDGGNEIVTAFTSLTKELFVYLFLHSVKWDRGVSAEKLNEILWFDKDEKSARNNRSVNIAKLKRVLDQMGHCTISRDTGYWKIDVDYKHINVDYHNYLNIISDKSKLDKHKIIQLAEICQRGSFLSNCEYEWIDQIKSEISNEIIDTYLKFANAAKVEDDPEFLIKIANYIFHLDPVNEEAMELKCKALAFLGKHSLAKSTFDSFKKEYKTIYAEDFKKDFHSVLEY